MRTSGAEALRLEDGGLNRNADNQLQGQDVSRLPSLHATNSPEVSEGDTHFLQKPGTASF